MDLPRRAEEWIAADPNPADREALRQASAKELAEAFSGPLRFGTAGLRAPIGAGESRMNTATITRTTFGLATWLKRQVERPRVVVGCDARHRSGEFHDTVCEVLSAAGCEVYRLPKKLPTPVTSFSVRFLDCDAGVMVTASHNPPQDNGYKVYLGGEVVDDDDARGVQLIAPADKEIQDCIDAAPDATQIALIRDSSEIVELSDQITRDYLQRLIRPAPAALRIVITAMHGVGGRLLEKALHECGHTVIPVQEQQEPDPDFPTVDFPNPEEDGALDLALATAKASEADLVLAVDPDADRLSVAEEIDGTWHRFTGDQVGAILGDAIAKRTPGGVMATSVVSSRLLERIAQQHGLQFAPTLTGFKWIGRTPGLIFGYEEAIGYCTDPQAVRDKDGISAAVRVAELAADMPLQKRWEQICETYGTWLTDQLVVPLDAPEHGAKLVDSLLSRPPQHLGGEGITRVEDLSTGFQGLPPTPGVWLLNDVGERVVIRPSGTEPKLKCYLEVTADTTAQATRRLSLLIDETTKLLADHQVD